MSDNADRVLLFTSCINAAMGPSRDAPDQRPLPQVLLALFRRAGYESEIVDAAGSVCCGMPFSSKGFPDVAAAAAAEVEAALDRLAAPDVTVVSDTSPCSLTLRRSLRSDRRVLDIAEALASMVLPRLNIVRKVDSVALHVVCSIRRMGSEASIRRLVQACAHEVVVPQEIECCGFAGDKGFFVPQLNASALRNLAPQLEGRCTHGVSTSRTCEIGLSVHGKMPFQSVAYLLDWCSSGADASD
jgi:D-lactate dehydrogenase